MTLKCEKCGAEATRKAVAIFKVFGAVDPDQVSGCVCEIPACDKHEAPLMIEAEKRARAQFAHDLPKLKARRDCAKRADALKVELHTMEREYKLKGAADNPNIPAAYALHKDFVTRYQRFKSEWEQMEGERDAILNS